jgi:hypothetical protein
LALGSKIRLLGGTFVLAAVVSYLLMIVIPYYLFFPAFVMVWPTLYVYWPRLRQWRAVLKLTNASAPRQSHPPVPRRPLWQRLVRGTLQWVGGVVLALLLMSLTVVVPVGLSFHRARKAHDAVHIGMTVPEVLHAVTDCDLFGASSEIPLDDKAAADNIPAVNLGSGKDGNYRMYDLEMRQDLRSSESEAIERLQAKLHDRYPWHFYYTYINMTPMHVTFSVIFGPDGRVTEVKPVYGFD